MNKKKLFLWCLYDFANSFVFINFLLYFSQWLVIDGGLSDFWYNAVFAIATLLLIGSAPILAAYTDKHGGRKFLLNISTLGTFTFYSLAGLSAYIFPEQIFLITLFFLAGQYFYQLAFVFYNPMIDEVADSEHRTRASGIGQFSNSIGQMLGLVATLPFAATRLGPLFPAILIFIVLALPMMIFFREIRPRDRGVAIVTIKTETKIFTKKMFAFFSMSVVTPMLLSYFFFNDALITLSNNYPIYMERVLGVLDSTKSFLLMGILGMSAIGGIVAGWVGDKIGTLRTMKFILVGWIILIPILGLVSSIPALTIVTLFIGTLIGSIWTVTRAYLASILPKEQMAYGFSFYTLAERFATFLGPLTWGGIVYLLGATPSAYRVAVISMTPFVIIGLIIISVWKRKKETLVS